MKVVPVTSQVRRDETGDVAVIIYHYDRGHRPRHPSEWAECTALRGKTVPLNNLAYRLRGSSPWRRLTVVAALLTAAVILAFVFTQISSGEQRLASWWPAAGFAAGAAIIAKRRELPLVLAVVLVSTGLASLLAHRPVVVAVAGAVGITAQCWLVRRFAVDREDRPRLFTLGDAARLTVGIALGGVVIGATVFAARLTTSSVDTAFTGAFQVAAGTTSAIVLIVPFFVISRRRRSTQNVRVVALSCSVTTAAAVLAFWPSQEQAFAFLPLPFLAWASLSLTMPAALVQVIIVNAIALTSTGVDGGPFSAVNGPISAVAMIEIYVIASTAMCVFIAAVRNERDSNAEQHAASTALMRQGFARAGTGYLVLRDTEHDTFGILDVNDTALALMPESFRGNGGQHLLIEGSHLHRLCLEALGSHTKVDRSWTDAAPLSVVAEELPDTTNDRVLLVTVMDLSAVEAARRAANEQLRQERETSERLRQTNEKHDLFVASVTHELRTPLTSIVGYTEEALEAAIDDEQRGYLKVVQRNADRLFTLVQDVLNTTHPHSSRETHAKLNLNKIIEDTVDDLQHEATSRGVTLTASAPLEMRTRGSELEIRRGLVNLVANAVKFTPSGGYVMISVSSSDDSFIIDVSDSGPGMNDVELAQAFDRFYRSNDAVAQGIPGTGLGLGIARDVIEANGGTLTLHHNSPHGLTARMQLPRLDGAPLPA
ncbi:MAG: ATP-binding protein [Microbacterium enclense]